MLCRHSPSYIPAAAQFVNIETAGSIATPAFPINDPNRYPVPGTIGGVAHGFSARCQPKPAATRKPIQFRRAAGDYQEFVLEAAYVGNRVVWAAQHRWAILTRISPQQYAAFEPVPLPGTGPRATGGGVCAPARHTTTDRNLLTQSISSTAVVNYAKANGITTLFSCIPASQPAPVAERYLQIAAVRLDTPTDLPQVIPSTTLYK